jgi:exodeoxyribonuclease VII large subunit
VSQRAQAPGPAVLTVSELTRGIKRTLAEGFSDVWVKGEISNFKRVASGHMYFNLKDEGALLPSVMFRMANQVLTFAPVDGMEVEARGSIDVYPPRGGYQLIIREMLPGGRGALLLALEALRRKLAAEGLFDPARKKEIPKFPTRIALVTSPTGAAVRDLLHVLARRWPLAQVVVVPVPVQGPGASTAIASAIERVNHWGWPEVMIVGRGGGSLEDLWAFNEEPLLRAVAASRIPTVSAVGHEVDRTLCDDVADLRAPTPSAAAELVVPDHVQVRRLLTGAFDRLVIATERAIGERAASFSSLREAYGFRRPQDLLGNLTQTLDRQRVRLVRATLSTLAERRARAGRTTQAYGLRRPGVWIEVLGTRLAGARRRLGGAIAHGVDAKAESWRSCTRHLGSLSPRAVLARGYSLVRLPDGRLVRRASEVEAGARLAIEFAEGGADAVVERVREDTTG